MFFHFPELYLMRTRADRIIWSTMKANQAPSSPMCQTFIKYIANKGLIKSTVTKVMTAIDLVSPAPLKEPDKINWEDWRGWVNPTNIIILAPCETKSGESL